MTKDSKQTPKRIIMSNYIIFAPENNWTIMKYQKPKEVEHAHQGTMMVIGDKLERLRTANSLTASKLCEEVGVSRNAYRQMTRGEVYFNTHKLLKVLDYYHIDLTTFFKTDIEDL